MRVFHIVSRKEWELAVQAGEYRPASLQREGFVHLSEERQWPLALQRFFSGQSGLVLLELEPQKLAAELRYEPADGDLFPHLYGALNLDAVVSVRELQ